jgi:hypothetical protein
LPGTSAARAAAAESSQAVGRVTERGAVSGSGEASVRRIRTPCQVRWGDIREVFMAAMLWDGGVGG